MPIYLQGFQLTTNAAITSLKEGIKSNVVTHSFYGSDVIEVEQVSINERSITFSMLLRKEDMVSNEQVEFVVNNIQGLVSRMAPLQLHCDEHPLYGGSNDIFIVADSFDVDWQTGKVATDMVAIINFTGKIIGTPRNLFGVYGVKSQRRNGDYTGQIAGRSTIGLPFFGNTFIAGSNITYLEVRNGTQMLNLGDTTTGFANDVASQAALEVQAGEVKFNIDVASNNFTLNGVRLYDEGYAVRKRVYSKTHEILGDCTIENELYRVTMRVATGAIDFYASTGVNGSYSATKFQSIIFPVLGFNQVNLSLNSDEIVRVKMNSGDYLEMERGKDPVLVLNKNDSGFTYSNGPTTTIQTTGSVNYLNIDTNVYVASNHQFRSVSRLVTPLVNGTLDQVFQFIYYTGTFSSSGRNRECLKEIS